MSDCTNAQESYTCKDLHNCCSCGIPWEDKCCCPGCWDCNACENCKENRRTNAEGITILMFIVIGIILGWSACCMRDLAQACQIAHENSTAYHKCVNSVKWSDTGTILKSEIKE